MPTEVRFRRGSSAANNSFTGAQGEISVDTDKDTIRVHDGVTAGGFELARANGSNLSASIDALSDVVINSPEQGNLLTHDGTNWINSDTLTNTNGNFTVERTSNATGTNSVLRIKKTRTDGSLATIAPANANASDRDGPSFGFTIQGTDGEKYFGAIRGAYTHPVGSEAPEASFSFSASHDNFTTGTAFNGAVSRTIAVIAKPGIALNGADWVRMPTVSRTNMYAGINTTFNTSSNYSFGIGCMVLVSDSNSDVNALGYSGTNIDITAATATGTAYTITIDNSVGILPGERISVTGVTPTAYNVVGATVVGATATTLTYTGATSSPTTGTSFGVVDAVGKPYQLAVWNGYAWNYIANGKEVTRPA
jgi:hypothetical protein